MRSILWGHTVAAISILAPSTPWSSGMTSRRAGANAKRITGALNQAYSYSLTLLRDATREQIL